MDHQEARSRRASHVFALQGPVERAEADSGRDDEALDGRDGT